MPWKMSGRRQGTTPTFPPCDQCLCRKIRCDKSLPRCHRCLSADLSCTRDIVRRRPGRKKGSGLVIARLRTNSSASVVGGGGGGDQQWTPPNPTNPDQQQQRTVNGDAKLQAVEVRQEKLHASRELDNSQRKTPSIDLLGYSLHPSDGAEYFVVEPWPPRTDLSQPAYHDSPTNRLTIERAVATIANIPNLYQHIDYFFAELYPIWPIIPELSFRRTLIRVEDLDLHQSCLVLSICALSSLHIPESTAHEEEPRKLVADRFIKQCLQLRTTFDYIGSANVLTIQTSLFLSCAEVEFQRARASWFLLREAIMLAQELGYYEKPPPPSHPSTSPSLQTLSPEMLMSLHRTLYLISLTERGLTVLRNKSFAISMFDSPPPTHFEGEDPRILYGLQSLNLLFNLLDKPFLDAWISSSTASTTVTVTSSATSSSTMTVSPVPTLITGQEPAPETTTETPASRILAAQQLLSNTRFSVTNLTDVQMADILITQQWLRLVFWQASMRQGLLSSTADEPALGYDFPCEIARALRAILEVLPKRAMIVHGMAIFERIFEIAYSFIDSLSLSRSLMTSGLAELRVLFRVLRDSPNSHHTYIHILETKFVEQGGAEGTELISLLYGGSMESSEQG